MSAIITSPLVLILEFLSLHVFVFLAIDALYAIGYAIVYRIGEKRKSVRRWLRRADTKRVWKAKRIVF